ncbi:ComEC/Rec2 family competence protein [Kribbella pittospori]|uniref:ComEC/Rec2 family competence protein n=1 Tax=Kribbella pittospori TaxID=722689 RepID=A0A4V2MC34_9ACTN|nr:ComEC/Rec2 family competence protein [Kribbella pittospori]TCC65522.1 ComEC/Rec2 family competence protein [Kribbella pittospori]
MSASDEAPEQPGNTLDLRLLAPAGAGWLAAVVLVGERPLAGVVTAAVSLAVACVAAVFLRRRLEATRSGGRPAVWAVVGVLVVVAGMGMGAALQVKGLQAGPVQGLAAEGATVGVRLRIDGDPAVRRSPGGRRPPYVVLEATIEEVRTRSTTSSTGSPQAAGEMTTRVRTRVLVVGDEAWKGVRFGERVDGRGRLEAAERGGDVAAMLSVRGDPRMVDEPAWWLRAAEQVRAGLRGAVAGEPDDVKGLVPALVMGDESGLSDELADDFRTTGLTHLSAVSGTNLTLLLAFILPFSRLIGVRARGLTAVGLMTVVVFVILARPQPSVLRAAAMGLIALAAMTSGGGQRRAARSLSVAVIVLLLLDTSLARSAGFALSVLATAGIVLLGPSWRDALSSWLPTWLAEAISCPLAAQLACTPIVAWLSGQVSLVAVAANLLAGPAVGPATILGFAAAGVALVSTEVAHLVGWAAGWPARWIILIAREGADLPGASNPWPATVIGVAVLTILCLAIVIGLHRILARPIAAILAVVLLAVVVLRPVGSIGWPPGDWLLVMCDVGQGDGLALRAGEKAAVVVDTGPDPAAMDRCLRDLGVEYIPVLVLTHFHADHAGGLAGVLKDRRVGEIEVTPYFSPRAEYDRVVDLAAQHGIRLRTVMYHEKRVVGALSWTTLWPARVPALPPPGTSSATSSDEGSPENNASIAMMVEASGLRILLTGDLEPESQRAILASGADLRADVLKVPHHGSAQQDPTFIAATGARLALISVGRDNDYGHPAPRTLTLLAHQSTRTATTSTNGPLTVTNPANHLTLTTAHNP